MDRWGGLGTKHSGKKEKQAKECNPEVQGLAKKGRTYKKLGLGLGSCSNEKTRGSREIRKKNPPGRVMGGDVDTEFRGSVTGQSKPRRKGSIRRNNLN